MNRGVVYCVWGDSIRLLLDRSINSLRAHHPDLPIEIIEGEPARGLKNKPRMYEESPFQTTLFLDADTVVLGDLTYGFEAADCYGLAVCVGECPWLRRYGHEHKDQIEYNTGVIFFEKSLHNSLLFQRWKCLVEQSPRSSYRQGEAVLGLAEDDQFGFSKAVSQMERNPHVLPLNWNFRPGFHTRLFTPLKIWHSTLAVPERLKEVSTQADQAKDLIQFCVLRNEKEPHEALPPGPVLDFDRRPLKIDPSKCDFRDLYTKMVNELAPRKDQVPPLRHCQMVEVGCFLGESIIVLSQIVEAMGRSAHLFAVDTFKGSKDTIHEELIRQCGGSFRSLFQANLRVHGAENVRVIQDPSVEAAKRFADGDLDFVFIDAEHTFAEVAADIRAWLPKVRSGGILAGHDLSWPEVRAAVQLCLPTAKPISKDSWIWRKP